MKQKILSVIIPIYNSGKYLNRCVDSILNQGLEKDTYEIILVNDGSLDNSLDICEQYQQQYGEELIKIVSQPNQGVSMARNNGLKIAQGEFVNFIDSDDYLIPKGLHYLLSNFLSESIDILSYWSMTLDKNTYKYFKENNKVEGKICFEKNGHEFLCDNVQTSVVTSLYRKDFLVKNGLEFSHLCIGEDVYFNIKTYLKCPRIRMVSSRLYRYDLHPESAIHNRQYTFTRKGLESYLYLFSFLVEKIREYKTSNAKLSAGLRRILEEQLIPFISRLLSSDLSVRETCNLRSNLQEKGILPLEGTKRTNRLINFIFKSCRLIKLYQFLFQRIFIPYIFPHLNRN